MDTTHTPKPPPSRGARLATVGILGIISAAGIGASFTQRVEHRRTDHFAAPAPPVLTFNVQDSTVDVATADTRTLTLTRAVKWSGPDGPQAVSLVGNELKMRGCDVPGWKSIATFRSCTTRDDLTVPVGQTLTATNDLGSLRLRGTYGALKLTTDVGDIRSTSLSAQTLDATVDVGDLNLVFTTSPDRVVARTDIGSVTLTLPAGQYNITATADVGSVSIDKTLVNSQSAKTINVRADLGDVTIRVAR